MKFIPLNAVSIPGYLDTIESLRGIIRCDALEIQEVGDGNVNFVYRVTCTATNTTLILKQAVPYLRLAGESWPLSRSRMRYEARALKLYESLVPTHSPKLLHVDEKISLLIMQYLSEHTILRYEMVKCRYYPLIGEHLSTFLAETLFKTSSFYLDSGEKRKLVDQFNQNTDLCKLTEELIFSFPFMDAESNYKNPLLVKAAQRLRADTLFKINIATLKYRFMTKADALIHGDLHTGSIMVSNDETFVIDPEFAVVGPFGFDIGKLVGNFLLSYISHFYRSSNSDYGEWLLSTALEILEKFQAKFLSLWATHEYKESALFYVGYFNRVEIALFRQQFMREVLQEAIGYAGCVMARRVLGIAGVVDIRGIEDPIIRTQVEAVSLELAKILVKSQHLITSTKDFELIVRTFFESVSARWSLDP
jgi:5-methylthioribose kinase